MAKKKLEIHPLVQQITELKNKTGCSIVQATVEILKLSSKIKDKNKGKSNGKT